MDLQALVEKARTSNSRFDLEESALGEKPLRGRAALEVAIAGIEAAIVCEDWDYAAEALVVLQNEIGRLSTGAR
jgi:hypothetical protein